MSKEKKISLKNTLNEERSFKIGAVIFDYSTVEDQELIEKFKELHKIANQILIGEATYKDVPDGLINDVLGI